MLGKGSTRVIDKIDRETLENLLETMGADPQLSHGDGNAPDKEDLMTTIKSLAALAAAIMFTAPAYAVTVENKSADAITIGIDYGAKEEVKEIGANKSLKFDCPDGCGVTGPWGFSWMAQGDDVITTDGNSLVGAEG